MLETESPLRVVFLSSDSGGGHNAVARALADGLEQTIDVECCIVNVYQTQGLQIWPQLSKIRAKSQLIWSTVYHLGDRPWFIRWVWKRLLPSFMQPLSGAVGDHCDDKDPHMIVAVHHASAQCTESLASDFAERPFTVVYVTDYDVHANWVAEADLYFASSKTAYRKLSDMGKRVMRLPMLPCKYPQEVKQKPAQSADHVFKIIMVMGLEGSSKDKLNRLMGELIKLSEEFKLEVSVICGRNANLENELRDRYKDQPVMQIHGFVTDMSDRMQQADLALIRLSPQTMTEALAAGTPVIGFDWHVHEAENLNVLHEFGAGTGNLRVSKTVKQLRRFLTDADLRSEWYTQAYGAAMQAANPRPAQVLLDQYDDYVKQRQQPVESEVEAA